METITQKEIGHRISELRKRKDYSQDNLAMLIGMSRPSITQIELENSALAVIELKKIAEVLSISIDHLLSSDFSSSEIPPEEKGAMELQEIRVSVPELKVRKFKDILLYILERM